MTDMCHPTLNLGFLLKGCKGEVAGEEHMKKQLWNDGRILQGGREKGGGDWRGREKKGGEGRGEERGSKKQASRVRMTQAQT